MKIAIVTPHHVPLALGGAENLWWGLQNHFEQHTEHRCDIVSVMSPEGNFWDLIESYETFSKLDLSAYDCVISGKYPGWMVNHPNHICYMLHRLRGLYDTYSGPLDDAPVLKLPKLRNLAEWLENGINDPDPDQIPELFDRLRSLKDAELPEEALAFPGPFSRAVIHFLDNAALSPRRIRNYAAISETVAKRKGYFPPGAAVDVLYPPPHRDNYYCGESRYFFTSSRLDGPKRIGLLIDAMKHVPEDIELWIGGTGPEEDRLKALAGKDQRIRFLGYVPDDDMPELYANSRAVLFVPADEDYGLITIEAMKSSKPVISVTDSGGPCEFVDHGETGFICDPKSEALAVWMSKLAQDEPLAKRMGEAAFKRVEAVSWDVVTGGLMEPPVRAIASKAARPKLTVATTFKVFPPVNGGQARVFHLYRNLARFFDIDIISLGSSTDVRSESEIAPGVLEVTIPRGDDHITAEHEIARQVGHKPVGDVTANALLPLTPAYGDALELSAITSMAVIACHPYTVDTIKQKAPSKPLWYEAQDVEVTLKSAIFSKDANAAPLLNEVTRAERTCWQTAERVFACAERDLDELKSLYGPTIARLSEVPNGVSLEDIHYTPLTERRRLGAIAGLADQQFAAFIGSWHGPNLEALETIIEVAPACPNTRFAIVGSVCNPFQGRELPSNVELLGAVDMMTRDNILSIADVALNPMLSGSGTNLKMLDYMAAGVPVISTTFGARGLLIEPDKHYLASEPENMAETLLRLRSMDDAHLERMIVDARELVEKRYSWAVVAEQFANEILADDPDKWGMLAARDAAE